MPLGLPDPVDVHVGERLRLARMATGLPQSRVGEALGISTQQVQKYEKGVNRLGAGKLYRLARLLDVSVGFFFDGMPDATEGIGDTPLRERGPAEQKVGSGRRDRDVIRLVSAYLKIPDRKLKTELTAFVLALQKSLDSRR